MRKVDYINAVYPLLTEKRSDSERVITQLKKVLGRRGHSKLYKGILEGLHRKLETVLIKDVAQVTVAREKDLKRFKNDIDSALTELNVSEFQHTADRTVIGGCVIQHNNKVIDKSYKSRLVTLYRSLTE